MPSLFSKIVAGEIPCHQVWEDDKHLAFLDINPWVEGHTLVIPKAEQDYLFDMDDDAYAALHLAAKKVARQLKEKLGCARVCTMVMGYEIPHVHIHLLPTNTISDFANPSEFQMKDKPDLESLVAKLASAGSGPQQFAEAFNARDIEKLKSLHAPDATAQVMDSPFPEEKGIDDIAAKSLNHMLDEEAALKASAAQLEGRGLVLFHDPEGRLDAAAWVSEEGGLITRMEYIVQYHREEELKLIGLKVRNQN